MSPLFSVTEQRGHLSAHASEGQCVEYANREILAELKIESVNIMVIRRHPSTVQNKTANTLKITKFLFTQLKCSLYTGYYTVIAFKIAFNFVPTGPLSSLEFIKITY